MLRFEMDSAETKEWVRKRYSFLSRDFDFRERPDSGFGIVTYESTIVHINVCWYRDPGVAFFVQPSTFWIRPADPRTFQLWEVIATVDPAVKGEPELDYYGTDGEARVIQFLNKCADDLIEYALPILQGHIRFCEDVLILRGLKELKCSQ